jgi:hypothetical protein
MLEPDPELIHFDKVGEHEPDRVLQVTAGSTISLSPLPGKSAHPSLIPIGRQSLVCPLR